MGQNVSKEQALTRFKTDFPDLAGAAGTLESNPFPASFEVQLKADVRESTAAVDGLVSALNGMGGVADVRYDREWLARLNLVVRMARIVATGIVALLAIAAYGLVMEAQLGHDRALAERDDGDHCGHADDDAQRGQDAAPLVGA